MIYKGYIKKIKFENEENKLYKPILFLKYSEINKIGHFNLIHIKEIPNIEHYIKDIPKLINKRYNYHYLRKINLNNYNITKINNNNKKINNILTNNNNNNILEESEIRIFYPSKITIVKNEGDINNNILNQNKIEKNLLKNTEININNKYINDYTNKNNYKQDLNDNDMYKQKERSEDIDLESEYEETYKLSIKDLKNEYYPINKTNINSYNYYYNIHVYLLSVKENKKHPIYPSYINEYEENIENNKKKYFRNICMNYELNNYNELCFKKLKNKKFRKNRTTKNRHKLKNINDYIFLKIPLKINYLELLNKIHLNKSHCSIKHIINI